MNLDIIKAQGKVKLKLNKPTSGQDLLNNLSGAYTGEKTLHVDLKRWEDFY
jgi:hypothetical protein